MRPKQLIALSCRTERTRKYHLIDFHFFATFLCRVRIWLDHIHFRLIIIIIQPFLMFWISLQRSYAEHQYYVFVYLCTSSTWTLLFIKLMYIIDNLQTWCSLMTMCAIWFDTTILNGKKLKGWKMQSIVQMDMSIGDIGYSNHYVTDDYFPLT